MGALRKCVACPVFRFKEEVNHGSPPAPLAPLYTMSTLLAAKTLNANQTHPLFHQRNYSGYTHATLHTLGIFGRPFIRELAYDGYRANIDVFIAATNRQKKLSCSTMDAEIYPSAITEMIPLQIPRLAYVPATPFKPDQEASWLTKVKDSDPQKVVQGKQSTYIINKPNIAKAMVYYKTAKSGTSLPENTVSPVVFASYAICLSIITEFLKTNTYPAFLSPEAAGEFDNAEVRMRVTDGLEARFSTSSGFVHPPIKKVHLVTEDENQDQEMEEVDEEHEEFTTYTFTEVRSAVFVAKPSRIPLSFNIGEPSEVPNLPGRAFPYFDRMNIPEGSTIRNVISTYFLRNLGETRSEQMGTFRLFRNAWESLSKTQEGGVVAHIMTGIRLSLETQTRLFIVIRSGEYCGFCLLGALWSCTVDKETFDWVSAEELRVAVDSMSSHAEAKKCIALVLSSCPTIVGSGEGLPREVKVEDISSSVKLWNAIKGRRLSEKDKDELTRYFGLLAYTRSYRQPDAAGLQWLFERMADTQQPDLPDDSPLFIPPNFDLYSKPVFQYLCSFGPNAPSFVNSSGSTFLIPPTSENDTNEEVDAKGKKRLPHILVSLKPVSVAYGDMMKVVKDRAIKMDLAERAGKNRNLVFGGEQRNVVYEGLREMLNKVVEVPAKRGLEEGNYGGPQRKKMLLGAEATAKDILDLF